MLKKSRGDGFLIKHITEVYTELYSDEGSSVAKNLPFVKAVFDSLMSILATCKEGDRVKIPGLGTFLVLPQKRLSGHFKHYRSGKLTHKTPNKPLPRIRFAVSNKLKKAMAIFHEQSA